MIHYEPFDPEIARQWFSVLVGMIQGNEEKIRFNWSVKSLPWLILTDRKHIVTAEGFGLDKLEDKIRQSGEVK